MTKYLLRTLTLLGLFSIGQFCAAQTVSLGLGGQPVDSSAILELSANDKGVLIPRMDSTSRKNITNPAIGLMVFDSTNNAFMYYNGTNWNPIASVSDNLGNHIANQNIQLSGNWLSPDGTNHGMLIDSLGNVGIIDANQTATSDSLAAKFHVKLDGGPGFQVHDTVFILNEYTIPVTDGQPNQVLVSDSNGRVTWANQLNLDEQDLSLSGNNLLLTNDVTPANLDALLDNTDAQELSLVNDSLFITNGTPVDLGPYLMPVDSQDLSLSGTLLSMTNDPTPVDLNLLSGVDDQHLSFTNDSLFLIGDATPVDLSLFKDADTLGNHIATQNLQLNNHWLSGDGDNEGLWIDSVGQMGVGIAPQAKLHVDVSGQSIFQITDSTVAIGNYFLPTTDGLANQVIQTDGQGQLSWVDQINTDHQTLALSNDILSLANDASPVVLTPYLDNTDNQQLTFANDSLFLTNDATGVDLSGYTNTDEQVLSWSNDSLFISNDLTGIDLSAFRQQLTFSNDSLILTEDATPVAIGDFRQSLSSNNDSLFISGTNSGIDLSPYRQRLTTNNDSLFLSNDPNGVDLSEYINIDEQYLQLDPSLTILSLTKANNSITLGEHLVPDQQQFSLSNDTLYITNDSTGVYLGNYKDADDLGNHTATQPLKMNNYWLSNDGDNEGLIVDSMGQVGVGLRPNDARFQVIMDSTKMTHNLVYQPQYNSGNAGSPFWQSFTPEIDGEITNFHALGDGVRLFHGGTYELYEGEGLTGTLLYSGTVDAGGVGNVTSVVPFPNIPLASGQLYTVNFPQFNWFRIAGDVYPHGISSFPNIDIAFLVVADVPVGFRVQEDKVGIQRVALTNRLEIEGEASKTTAGAWVANSDERLKKNIIPLAEDQILNRMLSLQGLTYEWDDDKTGSKRPMGIQYGFTAQNIQDHFPTLVAEDALGYLQTGYGTLDAMKVEGLRALQLKIEQLQAQNKSLHGQLDAQVTDLQYLEKLKKQLAELSTLEKQISALQNKLSVLNK